MFKHFVVFLFLLQNAASRVFNRLKGRAGGKNIEGFTWSEAFN